MRFRWAGWLVVGACFGLLCGCQRSKPIEIPLAQETAAPSGTESTSSAPITFALASPVGAHETTVAERPFEWVVINCDAQGPQTVNYVQAMTVTADYALDLDAGSEQARAYQDQIEAMLVRLYGIVPGVPRRCQQSISMTVGANTIATQSLHWEKICDDNEVVVHQRGMVVARVPVRVLSSAQLVAGEVQTMPCETQQAADALPGPTALAAPEPSDADGQEAQLAPAHPEAAALIRAYLAFLDAGELDQAYALLHPVYQARMSAKTYSQGYAPVTGVRLLGLSVVGIDDAHQSARAVVRITSMQVDTMVADNWLAEIEIMGAPERELYGRAIANIRMKQVDTASE